MQEFDGGKDLNLKGEFLDGVRDRERDARLNRLVARHGELTARSRDYANFILVAGYAAFFALWADVAQDVGLIARCATVVLLGLSLIVFIAWELAGMVLRVKAEKPFAVIRDDVGYEEGFEDRWDAAVAESVRLHAPYQLCWPWVLGFTIVTGMGGAAILTGAALAKVLGG